MSFIVMHRVPCPHEGSLFSHVPRPTAPGAGSAQHGAGSAQHGAGSARP